jgi:hypothetical protein
MLTRILNRLSSIMCLICGHQETRQVFTGKIAQVYHPSIKTHIPEPEAELQRVEFCLRCGKQLGPLHSTAREKYDNL